MAVRAAIRYSLLLLGVLGISDEELRADPLGGPHVATCALLSSADEQFQWTLATSLTLINGHYFNNMTSPYVRLPAEARSKVRPAIWGLAQQSAGLAVAFESDASAIQIDYNLTSAALGLWHMPPTGVSGADLWALDPNTQIWKWVATAPPRSQRVCTQLVALPPVGTPGAPRPKQWLLYLPLYNGVTGMQIGVPQGAQLGPCEGDCGGLGLTKKPVVWYGSSITQGACASKPGDAYTNAIARALRRPVANFGFSGSCMYEPSVVEFILEIDAAAFVVDCNPNSEPKGYEYVYNGAMEVVQTIRAKKPSLPILLASGTKEGPVWLQGSENRHTNGTAALRKAYNDLVSKGDAHLQFVDADLIYNQPDANSPFWEMTVAGTHPSSLGMERFTAFWTPVLRKVVGRDESEHDAVV